MAKRKPPKDPKAPHRDYSVNRYAYEIPLREALCNRIKNSFKGHGGGDYNTSIDELMLFARPHTTDEVKEELAKWLDLTGVDDNSPIVLKAKFFEFIPTPRPKVKQSRFR